MAEISHRLQNAGDEERDDLRGLIRIGLQWDTQVTLAGCEHLVSQAYCSALPVAYSEHASQRWQPFAKLVLEAAYEATILAAILNAQSTRNPTCFLTLLGGGAFGNTTEWIIDAMRRALILHADAPLDIALVSYGAANPALRPLLTASPYGPPLHIEE